MIVLGLDAAAKTAGVALLRDGQLLYESYLAAGCTHSETLLPLVDAALQVCRVKADDIDLFALTAGPGSFTGLRIGMALIKGLAAGRPCVPVSTLEALAAGCDAPGLLLPAMDARRGEVYAAAFWRDAGGLHRLLPDAALPAAGAAAAAINAAAANAAPNAAAAANAAPNATAAPWPVTLLGDGAVLCQNAWPKDAPPPRLAAADVRQRAAAAAARLGAAAAAAGSAVAAGDLRPDYHRLCQAERERLAALQPQTGAAPVKAAPAGAAPADAG